MKQYLNSPGSLPVSFRIFSSTLFKLSLAFSSWSCKLRTTTAILLVVFQQRVECPADLRALGSMKAREPESRSGSAL